MSSRSRLSSTNLVQFTAWKQLGTVHVLRHQVRGVGGLNQNDDFDDAFRGGWWVWDLNDDVMMVPFPLKIRRLLQ